MWADQTNASVRCYENSAYPTTPFGMADAYPFYAPEAGEVTGRGLGNGLSWGFYEDFCAQILPSFRDRSPAFHSGVTCDDLKQASRRAFMAWSLNNRHLTFPEVHVETGCPNRLSVEREAFQDWFYACHGDGFGAEANPDAVDPITGECRSEYVAGALPGCRMTELTIYVRTDDGICGPNEYTSSVCEVDDTSAQDESYYAERNHSAISPASTTQFGR